MRQLTPEGQQIINNIAQRYQFSTDAVISLLQSVINGNGSMAQFNHPEFGGSGQWMRGGMIMLGDMFNNQLKNRVGQLCQELSTLAANQPDLLQTGSFQSQTQGSQQQLNASPAQPLPNGAGAGPSANLFAPSPGSTANWWPAGLQFPNSTGAQNNMRYAYFATIRRLAIEANGHVTLYDTLDHQIGGFSQQQSQGSSITFTSQYGVVDVNSLPIISIDNMPPTQQPGKLSATPSYYEDSVNTAQLLQEADIFGTIEKLAGLKDKGILTDDEFNRKKAELLARL
ncbi:MAG: SHOCT domain-containing protein [Methylovulum sp.]|nr:SHOCT domain-containing protein [Methylovulum sp.]